MKACVLHAIGDLRVEEAPRPVPRDDEVLVRVAACGVCGSDIPRVFTKGTYHFPTIPGHEFAGVVEEAGEGVEADIVGKRVAVFPLIPCTKCPSCEIGAYAQCEDYDYLGSRSDGAFAEYVCAPEWNLLPVPEGVSIEEAAMVEPAAVALHALRRGGLETGDTLLVFGAGPIGLLLGRWAEASGASKVMLVDIDVAKLRFAKSLGFKHLLDAGQGGVPEWVRNKTGRGADVVIEGSGSTAAFEQTVQCARPFGSVVLMGNPLGDMHLSQKAYWEILRKELTVVGTWNSVYAEMPKNEWHVALDAMASGALDVTPLISHRCSLGELGDALVMMRERQEFFSKVMLVNETA